MLEHCCAGHTFTSGSWELRPTVQHDFQFLAQWNSCPPAAAGQLFDEIVLYTDGSFDPCTHVAAWAVVAAGRSGASWYRVGIAADVINQRLGKASAFVAELEALLHAGASSPNSQQPNSMSMLTATLHSSWPQEPLAPPIHCPRLHWIPASAQRTAQMHGQA